MKNLFARACFAGLLVGAALCPPGMALAEPIDAAAPAMAKGPDSTDFYDARGRLIGSRTRIGDASYLTSPDGRVVGVSTTVDGHRVFRSYQADSRSLTR